MSQIIDILSEEIDPRFDTDTSRRLFGLMDSLIEKHGEKVEKFFTLYEFLKPALRGGVLGCIGGAIFGHYNNWVAPGALTGGLTVGIVDTILYYKKIQRDSHTPKINLLCL